MFHLSLLSSSENAFGLDISELSLKLIKLKYKRNQVFLESFNEMAILPGLIVDEEIKKPEKLAGLINKLVKTSKGKKIYQREVVSVLPEPKTFIKLIRISSPKEGISLAEAIKKEAEHHIPLPIEEMYLDWQIIKNPFCLEEPDKIYILVGACEKNITNQYTDLLEKADLVPLALEIEPVAIARSLIKEESSEIANFAQIIIDLGATRTGLTLFDHGTIQFSLSLPISGTEITETIAKSLELTVDQAEKMKIFCGLDKKRCRGLIRKIFHNRIDELVLNIKNAINFYKNHFSRTNKVEKIILCGGGANFLGLPEVLSQKLNLKVTQGNPWANITCGGRNFSIPEDKSLSFTTAIGLALRGIKSKEEL
jgi:type IV pilus assembly protein PilM